MMHVLLNRCFALATVMFSLPLAAETADDWSRLLAAEHRTPVYVERDQYRHPQQTLEFFELKPDSVVVEIWPGGGWYTEILAPLLKERGTLYAAHFPAMEKPAFFKKAREKFAAKLAAKPEVYNKVIVTEFYPPAHTTIAPAGSADRVLTFRNVHNWMKAGNADAVLAAIYQALKPGGILGIVEHRAKPGTSEPAMIKSGYVTEQKTIALAEQAGFVFVAGSDINANPKDSKDHPKGVWTLPPSLRLKDVDREKYLAIGESDRMTLKFIKPDNTES